VIAYRSSEQIAQDAISPGETLKWAGVPPRGFYWRPSDWFAVPFSIVWCVLVVNSFGSALLSGRPDQPPLLGLLFVGAGLYFSVGRFFWDAYVRSQTVYAVSDRAVYFIVSGLVGRMQRLSGSQLENVQLRDGSNGAGTITFGSADPWWRRGRGYTAPAIEGVSNVRDVYDSVLAAGG
jgi:hypothetical protein